MTTFRYNGGHLPGLALIVNNLGRPERMVRFKKKRRPYMIIRREIRYAGGYFGASHAWYVYCTKCPKLDTGQTAVIASTITWEKAITATDRHARKYH